MERLKQIVHDGPDRGYPSDEDEWLTYDELAALIKVSKRTLWRWVALEKITPHRIGGWYVRFKRSEVEAELLEKRRPRR